MELVGNIIKAPEARPFFGRLVAEEGRISELAVLDERPGPGQPFICPGFIDAHTHPLELGLEELYANLAPCRSIDEVLAVVADRLRAGPSSGIMLGFNLEPDSLVEARYPARSELDSVTGRVPTMLYRVDGHSAVANSAAFDAGLVRTDLAGSSPDGVLRGAAYEQASRKFKHQLQPETVRRALSLAAAAAAQAGVTTIGAMTGLEDMTDSELAFLVETLSGLAVRAVAFLQTRSPATAARLGLGRTGGCVLIDGSFGSHTAALNEDYSDMPGNRGTCYLTDDELLTMLKEADRLGLQTAFHAIGDRAVEQLVRCHEQAGTFRSLKSEFRIPNSTFDTRHSTLSASSRLRHRIEHAELLSPKLIKRIERLGLVLCVQPAFEARWGGPDKLYGRRLGGRWKNTNPYRSLLGAGVVLAGGSDAPITPIDPLAGIAAALNHPNEAERIRAEQACALFTTSAAFSLGLEDKVGRLEPGLEADIVLLTGDPRSPEGCRVLATFRAGECIFRNPDSRFPIANFRLPISNSLFPTPHSPFPGPGPLTTEGTTGQGTK